MKKEMLWFFGAMAVVAMLALIVGMAVEVTTAKLVAMVGCILVGVVVSAVRDGDDHLIVPKFLPNIER